MSVTRKWSLLAGVLVLAILAAGWFLLVAPKRTQAADLENQVVSQEEANARLVADLEMLKAQQAELPEQRAELAVMRKQIPDNPALPTLVRSLTDAGRKVGVSIDTMAPAVPVAVVAPVTAVAPTTTTTTTTDGTSTDSSSTDSSSTDSTSTDSSTGSTTGTDGTTATTPTTTVPTTTSPSLYQVPLTLNVTGSYFELEQFINKLEGLKRSFLVTGFTVTTAPVDESATGDGSGPAPGDLTLTLQGRVFLAPPATTAATSPSAPAVSTASGQ
jgi:Tfp pilus assembly protein PilO